MIKLTIKGSLGEIYDYIEDKFILRLAELKLMPAGRRKVLMVGTKVQDSIGDTVFFIEKTDTKASVIVCTKEQVETNKIKPHNYGLAITNNRGDEVEIYIDQLGEALRKGLLPKELVKKSRNIGRVFVSVLGVLLIASLFVMPFVMIPAIVITVILYPFLYLKMRRDFRKEQQLMDRVISIFGAEFEQVDKLDTKDWIDFAGRVKSAAKDLVVR